MTLHNAREIRRRSASLHALKMVMSSRIVWRWLTGRAFETGDGQ
jgi:hypothetical protein